MSDDGAITWGDGCSRLHCKRFGGPEAVLKAGSASILAAKMIRDIRGNCGNCDIVHAEAQLCKLRAAREKREQSEWAKQRANSFSHGGPEE